MTLAVTRKHILDLTHRVEALSTNVSENSADIEELLAWRKDLTDRVAVLAKELENHGTTIDDLATWGKDITQRVTRIDSEMVDNSAAIADVRERQYRIQGPKAEE